MKLALLKIVSMLLALASPAISGTCDTADGECVTLFSDQICGDQELLGYTPTCAGNCYVYGFNSLSVRGDFFTGTNCEAYSDSNCQKSIGTTGNTFQDAKCVPFPGGNSMKCYYDC